MDKVVIATEVHQLPAPDFQKYDEHTKATLFTHREFKLLSPDERMRACYLHCVLRYLSHEAMTNTTLRERFGIPPKNKAQVSTVINASIDRGLIKLYGPEAGPRAKRYIPYWVD